MPGFGLQLGSAARARVAVIVAAFRPITQDPFRPLLFGESSLTLAPDLLALVVPLLALPQATHYLLDAFVWRPGRDPALLARLGWAPRAREGSPRGTGTPSPVAMTRAAD